MYKYLNKIPFHPAIFSLYFIAHFYKTNLKYITVSNFIALSIGVLIITVAVQTVMTLIIKNKQKAALFLFFIIFVFFSYENWFLTLKAYLNPINISLLRPNFIIAPILILVSIAILRSKSNLEIVSNGLKILAVTMFVVALGSAVNSIFKLNENINIPTHANSPIVLESKETLPNIYYIILDSHVSPAVMKKKFGYDNSEFVNYLKNQGFSVGNNVWSNYNLTLPSLGSSLNMNYLAIESPEFHKLEKWYENRELQAVEFLQKKGYSFIYVEGAMYSFLGSNLVANQVISDPRFSYYMSLRAFQDFLNTTLYRHIYIWMSHLSKFNPPDPIATLVNNIFREKVLYVLDRTKEISDKDNPVFALVHTYSSHPPFVFDKDGGKPYTSWVDKDEKQEYVEQTQYYYGHVKKLIESIRNNSTRPTIIIVRGDHGSTVDTQIHDKLTERGLPANKAWTSRDLEDFQSLFSIFYAVSLPDGELLPDMDKMIPVNLFRLIFNKYFGTNYELLKPKHTYLMFDTRWLNVTDEMLNGKPNP